MATSFLVVLAVSVSPLVALSSRAGPVGTEPITAPSAVPLLEITSPFGCNLDPSDVSPFWTFRWQTSASSAPPDSVRFIYLATRDFNFSYTNTENYIRNTPNAPEWSAWQPYAPPYMGSYWTAPASDLGTYVFAVHGKDREGNVDTEFTKTRNMRRVKIAQRENGPHLVVYSSYFDPLATVVTTGPPAAIELVAGTPVDFCWSADAKTYCGVVEGYRYGWDLNNPDDETQWGMPFTPFQNARECLPPDLVDPSGVHMLYIEAVDHAGFKSRARVQVTWHPAHEPAHPWSKYYGDVVDQTAACVVVDAAGNVVVAGNFSGTLMVGGGMFVSGGGTDVFIAKFNAFGTHLWSRAAGGVGTQTVRGLAVDPAGNVAVTGDFANSMDFGGGVLTSAGNRDVFLAVYSANGTHLWSKAFGDVGIQYGRSVAVDDTGNVVITGEVGTGTIDFGGGPFRTGIFAAKLDASGAHVWSKTFGATGGRGIGVAVDHDGSMFFTGGFVGTANFGNGWESSSGGADIFVTKLAADGSHQWNQHAGDEDLQAGYSVVVDGKGDVVMAGILFGQADLGGGPLVSAGGCDGVIAKFDADGAHVWSRRFGDALDQFAISAAVTSREDVLVTGYFAGVTDFGGSLLTSAGLFDAFLARYNADGIHVESRQFGDALNQYGRSVAVVHDTDDVFVLGDFEGTIDVGYGPMVSAGGRDVYLGRLESAAPVGVEPRVGPNLGLRCYPNPFNPGTTIAYQLPKAGFVSVSIYDVRGAHVRTLVQGARAAGAHEVRWDGRNQQGQGAPTGVYFVRLAFGNQVTSHKLVLLK